jgi:hypothetical protein
VRRSEPVPLPERQDDHRGDDENARDEEGPVETEERGGGGEERLLGGRATLEGAPASGTFSRGGPEPADEMPTIDEKRVYTDTSGTETAFVATSVGVVAVSVSDDLVGGFGLARTCHARDVASAGGRLAVATDEDVLVADLTAATDVGDVAFEETGFGPAVAVTLDGGDVLAADEGGRVARLGAAWTALGDVDAVRALDGRLVATEGGVHRVVDGGLDHAGLEDVRDVAAAGPFAATGDGLYRLGNGWMDVLDGAFDIVAASPDGRAHAVGGETLYGTDGGEWAAAALPVEERVAAVTHGADATYAVTDAGTFLVGLAGGEWRHRVLGLRDVRGVAVA